MFVCLKKDLLQIEGFEVKPQLGTKSYTKPEKVFSNYYIEPKSLFIAHTKKPH